MPANTSLPQPDEQGGPRGIDAAALVERLQQLGWEMEPGEYSLFAMSFGQVPATPNPSSLRCDS